MKNLLKTLLLLLIPLNCYGQYPLDLSKEKIKLPKIEDKFIESRMLDKDTIFYKLEPTWQQFIPHTSIESKNLTTGIVSYTTKDMVWGIYKTSFRPEFHANNDFPWEGTFGLNGEERSNIKTINFLSLPKEDGKKIPILLIRQYNKPYTWIFPTETMIGELILVKNGEEWLTQEVRIRIKSPGDFYWEPFIFRPISNREHLIKLIGNYKPSSKYMFFRNPEEEEVFKVEGLVERLPSINKEKVVQILNMEFKNVTEERWSDVSSAPSSDIDFNILPKNYNLGLIDPDQDNCLNCHRQTQTSVANLIPKEPTIYKNPEKVGNIRGSDSVFTWYPWHPEVALENEGKASEITVRKYDLDNKTFIIWDVSKNDYDTKRYRLTDFVQSSLKEYELPNSKVLHQR